MHFATPNFTANNRNNLFRIGMDVLPSGNSKG